MKICLINNLYKPYNRGGAERIVELITKGLAQQGHDVFVITTKPIIRKQKTENRKQKIYYINGFYYNLNWLPKFLRLFWHIGDMFDVGSYFKIKSILKKEKPDIVMTHNLKGVGYLIPKVIKYLGIKHVHTLHDIQLLHPSGLMIYGKEKQIDSVLAKIYSSICRWLFTSPNIVISPSRWLIKMHTDRGFFKQSKKVVLPNPVMNNTEKNNISSNFNSTFRFLFIGQIEEHKGILFLINTFNLLCKDLQSAYASRDINCELVIIGPGSKIKQAKKLASNKKHIKILGKISNKDLHAIITQFNALIVPSLCYENSPTVIYEAMAVGLPVLGSDIGGIPELLANDAGLIFKAGNKDDLMRQMKWAMEYCEELQKMGISGKKKIKQFGLDSYINKLINLIIVR